MESQDEVILCKSCSTPLTGIYCGQCGQKVIRRRLTLRSIFEDAFNEVTNVDRGLLYTFFMLLKKPDQVVLDYIAGRTVKYASPTKYLIFWTAVAALIYIGFGFYDQQVAGMGGMMPANQDPTASQFATKLNDWIKQNYQLVSILYIPFFALFTRLLFKKSGLNYAEHLVANAYFNAQASIVILPTLVFKLDIELISTLSMLIMVGYYTYTIRCLFKQGWIAAFFKSILIYLLGILLFIVLGSLVAIPIVILMKQ